MKPATSKAKSSSRLTTNPEQSDDRPLASARPAAPSPASAASTADGAEAIDLPEAAPANAPDQSVSYSVSHGFVGLMARLNVTVALSSYQSGMLYFLGRNPKGGLIVDQQMFQGAMGICVDGNSIILATSFQIHKFHNTLRPGQFINGTFDACYIPRMSYTTGILDAHDVGILSDGDVIFVNTRFNCLAKPASTASFEPVWQPSFISRIVDEDRCHLNGLAMQDGRPRYVTAASRSNTIDGWRDRRTGGGVVIDVETQEIVCDGLSMPHSPRLYRGKLWVLNAGAGELGYVDLETRSFVPVTFCPGFLRGLSFAGKYAFVGLSKPRYERFEGLPLDAALQAADSSAWCGIQVIDLETGVCADWFRIDGAVAEIYDVGVIPEVACPMSLGFASQELRTLITHADPPPPGPRIKGREPLALPA